MRMRLMRRGAARDNQEVSPMTTQHQCQHQNQCQYPYSTRALLTAVRV
ncbi:hypothetical protein GKQ77_05920 [Streptomyces sp. BG9H]|uniref:Uncharacterized protein n=1 Tax=Streptomyces anatolicus TaxID=2675858 RepID=A0ABS6YJ86_9ACTN|nr:hypothetical protein [Streptomyces anatolicus]